MEMRRIEVLRAQSVIPSSLPHPYSRPHHVAAALNCRIPSAHRRIAISALPEEDHWRVLVSEIPETTPDGSATIKVDRLQGLASALERVESRLREYAALDCERFHQATTQAFITWAYGRPGIRPRSSPGRERMLREADRYLDACVQYVQAFDQVRSHASEHGVSLMSSETPAWALGTRADLDSGKTLVQRRESLLQAIASSFRRHNHLSNDPALHDER
jgi:hypothetical protein